MLKNLLSGFPDENKSMFDSTKWWQTALLRKIQGLVSEPQLPIPSIPTLIAYTQTDEGQ